VPNLIADRAFLLAPVARSLNVRRLMYQSLIWFAVLSNDARRLRSPADAERLQGLANALIDRVRRDSELDRNFLGRQMLIDQPEAVELPLRQSGHAIRNIWLDFRGVFPDRGIRHSSCSFQFPFLPRITPRVSVNLRQNEPFGQEGTVIFR
jgi:hypothetical protein